MAPIKTKYVKLKTSDFNLGAADWTSVFFSVCNDCGVVVFSQTQHNKACIIVREGQIKK